MNDVVAIQHALFHGLRSCSLFNDFNVVLGRQFLVDAAVQEDAIWQTAAPSGKQGLGLIVQIPTLLIPNANSRSREREFSVGIFEERNLNFTPGVGTLTTAEDVGDLLIDFLWDWHLWRAGGLVPSERALVPDERFDGIVGLRAICRLKSVRVKPERAATPVITDNGAQTVSITVSDGSAIYYTTDGYSFPGSSNTGLLTGEQAATLYTGPFAVASGAVVLAGAFSAGLHPSQISTATIL